MPPNENCDALEDEDVETLDDAEARSVRKVERSFVSCESSLLALLDDVDDEAVSVCRSELSWLRSFCSVDRMLELLEDDVLLLAETPGGGPGGGPCGLCDALEDEDADARSFRKVERSVVSCESSLLALVDDDEEALSVCKSELSWLRSLCSVDRMLELLEDDVLLLAETPGGGPGGGPCGLCDAIEDEDVDDAEARSFRKVERSVVSCESSLLALLDDDDEALSACRSELSWLRSFCSVDRRLEPLDDDAPLSAQAPGGGP